MMEWFKALFKEKGVVVINGYSFSGRSVNIVGGKVIVDGVEQPLEAGDLGVHINVSVAGDVERLSTVSGDVAVIGDCGSVQTVSGDVDCHRVSGDVSTVSGDVDCGVVRGSVRTTSGDIIHR
jgi:hypothetical protein